MRVPAQTTSEPTSSFCSRTAVNRRSGCCKYYPAGGSEAAMRPSREGAPWGWSPTSSITCQASELYCEMTFDLEFGFQYSASKRVPPSLLSNRAGNVLITAAERRQSYWSDFGQRTVSDTSYKSQLFLASHLQRNISMIKYSRELLRMDREQETNKRWIRCCAMCFTSINPHRAT